MVATHRSASPSRRRRRRRRRTTAQLRRYAPWVGLVVAVLLVFCMARLISARQHLNVARLRLESARQAVLVRQDDQATSALDSADRSARSALADMRVAPVQALAAIPLLGSPFRAATSAGHAGQDGVAAGRTLLEAASSFPDSGSSGLANHDVTALHDAIVRTASALDQAQHHLGTAHQALSGPSHAALPFVAGPAKTMSKSLVDAETQVRSASQAVALLEELLDPKADRRFLLVAQDSLELRPTGGFIGSYGVLRIGGGKITLERYDDSLTLPPPEPPLDPPADLAASLPRYWGLSNTNWWPDFPTSASTAKEMFKRQGGGEVDGVIGVTEHLLGDLVGVLGPIQLPGYDQPVVQDGFDQRVVYEVELKNPPDVPQKKFLIELATNVLDRLFSAPADKFPDLVKAFSSAASNGDVQIWLADSKQEAQIRKTAVSGALPTTGNDFVMLVDSNMTASKANAGVVRNLSYTAEQRNDHWYGHFEGVLSDEAPAAPVNPYYNGYLRLYVPTGSRLLSDQNGQITQFGALDGPYSVFAQTVRVDPQSSRNFSFDYELPNILTPAGQYRLTWQRQVGTQRDQLVAVVKGRTYHPDPDKRTFTVSRSLQPSGIRGFLHRRSVFRWLGL